jgi:alpha-1,3-rhamnosyltransferase
MVDPAPLVSVIVISYNSSRWILETLESIKNQTYRNIELIISDDCSNDKTIEIAENWIINNSNRFRATQILRAVINSGIPANCNQGFYAAKGEFIKSIAADDILLPGCIQKNIDFISKHEGCEIIFSKALSIDDKSDLIEKVISYYRNDNPRFKEFFFSLTPKKQLKHYCRETIFLLTPTIFISKKLFELVKPYDERLKIFEDIPIIIKVLKNGNKLWYNPEDTVYYRLHNTSISKMKNKGLSERSLNELRYIFKNYRKPNLSLFNVFDFGCRFEAWLYYDYSLRYKLKGARFLRYLNIYRIYKMLFFK